MSAKKATSASARAKKPAAKAPAKAVPKASANGQSTVPTPVAAKKPAPTKPIVAAKTVPLPPRERSLSNDDIGAVAGEVWNLLNDGGGQTVAAIKKSVKAPADVVVAAIGWLARENKIAFAASGKTLKLSLK